MVRDRKDSVFHAFQFPLRDDGSRARRIAIGSLLVATSVLVVPAVFLAGYYVRFVKSTVEDAPGPPQFTDWKALFVDGVRLSVIGLLYSVILLLFALLGGVGGDVASSVGPVAVSMYALVIVGGFVVFLVAAPAMVVNFAVEGRIAAAFDAGRIREVVTTPTYLLFVFLAFVVNNFGVVFGSMLSVVLVGFVLMFYTQLVALGLVASGFARGADFDPLATREGEVSTPEPGERPSNANLGAEVAQSDPADCQVDHGENK